ncbi:MAG: plastocyanin/azurin family copper-binding protein [Verrucomicrobiota bacterium]
MKPVLSTLLLFSLGLLGFNSSARATDLIGGEAAPLLTPQESMKKFKLHPDYQINLYASEVEFPLHSPAAMTFDSRGRLWVGNIPTQPHAKPGVPIKDSVIVLEDTDKDGKADKHTVFAEGLYLPLGLAVADGGKTVYVTDEPNLVRLTDTDGDGKADEKQIMLEGFGTEDNHHFISAFQWGPDGRLYSGQGLFLNTQVETTYGPVRAHQAAVFRHDPRDNKLEVFASFGWSNVWGIVFDSWGQPFLADASPALNYYMSHTTSNFTYPKPDKYGNWMGRRNDVSFTPSGRRPSCGNEFLSSNHFPPEVRGWYLTNQMKGWHGVRWYKLEESGSGVKASQPYGEDNELLTTSDIMFRPVAQQIGPDGALYILDYYNPIVGHTTYSFRDPRHIKTHGRVWRITHKTRPLDWQPKIYGEEVPALLANLNHSNERARYLSRHELHQRKVSEVLPVVDKWIAGLSTSKPEDGKKLIEALWLHQNFNDYDTGLLKTVLAAPDHHVRTAALRVLRYWQTQMDQQEVLALLKTAIQDPSQRVRLEALIDLSFYADVDKALSVAALVLDQEMDAGCVNAAYDVFTYLTSQTDTSVEKVSDFLLPFSNEQRLLTMDLSPAVADQILSRSKLAADQHRRALDYLVGQAGQKDALQYLLGRLEKSTAKTPDKALPALEAMLLAWPIEDSKKHADAIASLMAAGKATSVRTGAQAVLLRAGAASGEGRLLKSDTLLALAVTRAGRGKSPDTLYPRFSKLLTGEKSSAGLVKTMMPAIASFPSQDQQSLKLLVATSDKYAEKNIALAFSALEAMRRIPSSVWPPEYSNRVLSSVTVSATPDLKFVPTEFSVKAGSAVKLLFRNPDNLYHNMVIVNEGALDKIGTKADMMAGQPDGLDKNYVPDDPDVLHFTPQITLGIARSYTLNFFAPDKPGEYPYICTFPGHWRIMRGVMKVVK